MIPPTDFFLSLSGDILYKNILAPVKSIYVHERNTLLLYSFEYNSSKYHRIGFSYMYLTVSL